MRTRYKHKLLLTITGSAALCVSLLMAASVNAAPIDPNAKLPGIPLAGYPSYTFNDDNGGFSKNVQGWFDNLLVVKAEETGYAMDAMSQGDFKLWESEDSYIQGSDGIFDLHADFDMDGNLLGGDVSIEGILRDLGIDEVTTLMTADLVAGGFAYEGNLVGFQIDNIWCAEEIVGCTEAIESIYFFLDQEFPGIAELAGNSYYSTMATKATVPLPATAWLMLSGIMILGGRAARRRQ
jgi:hypothetical protein